MKAALLVYYGVVDEGTPTWQVFDHTGSTATVLDTISAGSVAEAVAAACGLWDDIDTVTVIDRDDTTTTWDATAGQCVSWHSDSTGVFGWDSAATATHVEAAGAATGVFG